VKQDEIKIHATHLYERFEGAGLPDELRDRFDFDLELDLQKHSDVNLQLYRLLCHPVTIKQYS
jgi:hypothetical protein